MIIEGYSGIVGAVKAGQVKLIAVASAERLPQFPDLPTVAETLPGFAATRLASAGCPERHADADRQQSQRWILAKVVSDPDFKKSLANIGSYSRAMTPEQTLAFVEKEQQTWAPMLQKAAKK